MNRNEIIDILTAVQIGDHRTIGQGDIDFWAAIIGEVPKDDAMKAVIDHRREQPGVWLEPGHIYQRVRAIRRDMLEREHAAIIDAENDAKMALIAAELAETKTIPDEDPGVEQPPAGYKWTAPGASSTQATDASSRAPGRSSHKRSRTHPA